MKLIVVLVLLSCFFMTVSAAVCPYDEDYKVALKKGLIEYLSNPKSSSMQLPEVTQMLNFYLKETSITDADCTPEINALIEKAENGISDDKLTALQARDTCEACPDGAVCGEQNAKGQTCTCKDVDSDGKAEYCYLKPIVAPIPTCDVCPDGTTCDEDNAKGQSCICKDVNGDDKAEYCYLRPLTPSVSCHKHPDPDWLKGTMKDTYLIVDTGCQIAQDGMTYREVLVEVRTGQHCKEQVWIWERWNKPLEKGKCYLPQIQKEKPGYSAVEVKDQANCPDCTPQTTTTITPNPQPCDKCSDGTACGSTNANGQTCECKDLNGDANYEECTLSLDRTILHKCTSCPGGVGCWKCSGSAVCACKPEPHESATYYSCWFVNTCNGCGELACGQTNSKGEHCVCEGKQENEGYYTCRMECSQCAGGIACGQTVSSKEGKACVCRVPSTSKGTFLECLVRCDKCSDGTPCLKTNAQGKWCTCQHIDFTTNKYKTCQLA